jgi:predicted permease
MTIPSLGRVAGVLIALCVPRDWRESIAGDVLEERDRRRAEGKYAGSLWSAVSILAAGIRLTYSRRRDRPGRAAVAERLSLVERWRSDLAQSARGLAANRGYTLAAVAVLAIGLGANAAVFNLANWLVWRPLPGVHDASQLVSVMFGSDDGTRLGISVPDVEAVAAGAPALTGLAGYLTTPAHVAVGNGQARRVTAEAVSGSYFNVLGLEMVAGRGFTAEEGTQPGASPVAVISDRLWRQEFRSASGVAGRTMIVNRHTVTVIGVAARGFHGPSLSGATDLWMPVSHHRVVLPEYPAATFGNRRRGVFAGLIGRLAPGATRASANAQIEVIRARIADANPADTRLRRWKFFVTPGAESHPWEHRELRDTFTMLTGIVVLLLLLTAANAGNLMIGRTMARSDEIATRLALGASRRDVARLLVAESLLLSAVGGLAAVALAWIAARLLEGTVVLQGLPALEDIAVDWRVLAYASLLSTIVAVAAGLYPAFAASRVDVSTGLRAGGRAHTGSRQRLRRLLTAAQVAVSVTLLVGAALFVRSMSTRLAIDPGFDASRVLTISVAPGLQDYGARQEGFYGELVDRIRQVPGVHAAGVGWLRPSFQRVGSDTAFRPVGAPEDTRLDTDTNMVSPGYFDAIGLPILEGRDFSDAEFATASVGESAAIMTASLARKAFGTSTGVGRGILIAGEKTPRTIVGIVRDTRQRGVTKPSTDMLFLPFYRGTKLGWASIVVGLAAPDAVVVPRLKAAVGALDPTLPTYDVMRVDESIRTEFASQALVMRLTLIFGALATLVAAVGLYGVLARAVAERRREFGIRVALGASPAAVLRLVARESATVLVAGIATGAVSSALLAGYLRSHLYGVDRLDPVSFAGAILITAAVMLVAAAPAGRRAVRLDPVNALRG